MTYIVSEPRYDVIAEPASWMDLVRALGWQFGASFPILCRALMVLMIFTILAGIQQFTAVPGHAQRVGVARMPAWASVSQNGDILAKGD